VKKKPAQKEAKPKNTHGVVDGILDSIRDEYPEIMIGRGTQDYIDEVLTIKHFKSGIPQLDFLLNGGVPVGRFMVLYGPESSGKTTLAMSFIAQYMASNPEDYVLILDAENSVEPEWYARFGVPMERVIVVPGTMPLEDMVTAGHKLLRRMKEKGLRVGMALVDSIRQMSPAIEIEGKKEGRGFAEANMRQDHVGTAARKTRQFLSMWNPVIRVMECATIVITHVTVDIGGHGGLIQSGGYALRHFPHAILKLYRKGDDSFKKELLMPDGQKKEVKIGYFTVVTLEKTKVSEHEGKSIAIPFIIGVGFKTSLALLNSAVGYGIVERAGSWYKYKGESIGQGSTAAVEWFETNKLQALEIEQSLLTLMQSKSDSPASAGDDESSNIPPIPVAE
jgi:recombination protein RecA